MPTTAPHAAKPSKEIFDPFNSSGTGHQRAENKLSGSTSWRDSRTLKLHEQFKSGVSGGRRVQDTVGGGSIQPDRNESTEGRRTVGGLKSNDQPAILQSLNIVKDVERPKKRRRVEDDPMTKLKNVNCLSTPLRTDKTKRQEGNTITQCSPSDLLSPIDPNTLTPHESPAELHDETENRSDEKQCPQIFANVNVYINGSTAPTISDHKLKHVLTKHGARMSIALGRRTVTHVIIGRPSSSGGCGGGLSGSKIQKEIATMGKGIKFVTAEWVLESVKAGRRLPESRFEAMSLAPKGVGSIASMFDGKQRAKDGLGGEDGGG